MEVGEIVFETVLENRVTSEKREVIIFPFMLLFSLGYLEQQSS